MSVAEESETTNTSQFDRFIGLIREWLAQIDVNSQLFVELMNDEALPNLVRTLAVGVLIYIQAPKSGIIPGKVKVFTLIDDVLIMIIALTIIVPLLPEDRLKYYRQKYKTVAQIDEYEQILKSFLGVLWESLIKYVNKLRDRSYKKKTIEEVVITPDLQEDLFDETMEFVANLNLDPATMDKDIVSLPPPEKMISLLAESIETAQKDQEKEQKSRARSLPSLTNLLPSPKDAEDVKALLSGEDSEEE